jgi:hypothetical protein
VPSIVASVIEHGVGLIHEFGTLIDLRDAVSHERFDFLSSRRAAQLVTRGKD